MLTPKQDMRTPVTVLTGFLGSGKTTLLNRPSPVLESDDLAADSVGVMRKLMANSRECPQAAKSWMEAALARLPLTQRPMAGTITGTIWRWSPAI